MKRLLLAVFLASACSVFVASADARAEQPEPDPRLDQKVTVAAVAAPLEEVLADLSRETGVTLDLHYNLRNQKVTVLVDDQPLYVVMNNLRDLLDGLWFTKQVGDETGYYLKQKHGWQKEAARLRAEREAEKERTEAEFRQRVREAARIAGLPRDQLLAMLDTDPQVVVDALEHRWCWGGGRLSEGTCVYGMAAVVGGLSEAQLDMALEGQYISVPYNDLPAESRVLIDRVCQILEEADGHVLSGVDPGLLYLHVYRQRPPLRDVGEYISVWLSRGKRGGSGAELARLGVLQLWRRGGLGWLKGAAQVVGLTQAQLGQRLEATEAGRAVLERAKPKPPPAQGEAHYPIGYSPLKKGEALDLELQDEPGRQVFETVLETIHEKTGLQFVADSYVVSSGRLIRTKVPKASDEMMAEVAEGFGRGWAKEGDIYRLRSKNWYDDERLEPPLWLIQRLETRIDRDKRSSDFRLDDFVMAAGHLRDEQIEAMAWLNFPNPHYMGILRMAGLSRGRANVLRWYASLDALQRQKLRGDGIGMADLNPTQQAAFAACLNRAFKTELPLPQIAAATARLAVEAKQTQRQSGEKWISSEVVFTFSLGGGKQEKVDFWLGRKPVETETQESAH